jgi:hypothetical protein
MEKLRKKETNVDVVIKHLSGARVRRQIPKLSQLLNFVMESELLLYRAGALNFCTTVYIQKRGT